MIQLAQPQDLFNFVMMHTAAPSDEIVELTWLPLVLSTSPEMGMGYHPPRLTMGRIREELYLQAAFPRAGS